MPRAPTAQACAAAVFSAVVTLLGLPLPFLPAGHTWAQVAVPSAVPPAAPPAEQPPAARPPYTLLADHRDRRTGWRHVHSRFPLPKAQGLAALAGLYGDRVFEAHSIVLPRGSYAARLVDQPDPSHLTAPSVSVLTRRSKAALGVNGGYFDPNFEPVGMYILGGIVRRPFRQASLLSATVVIGSSGRLEIRTRSEPYADARYALQCGPLIIDPGGELGIRAGPGPEARRTVLALADGGELAVVSTTAVSLRVLAEALHDHPEAFGVARFERALNLDGGPSTAMSASFTDPPLQLEAMTPVRTVVVFHDRPARGQGPAKPAVPAPSARSVTTR
jgi:uncharacterized protein YigE (DUF2233 family)